uniref:AB hydrolase-1 domain-containing protein n=1 Tax=Timspurckia oligopyrenoides TaxID=708627 RepID=A0A7S0ZCA3_9RHOD
MCDQNCFVGVPLLSVGLQSELGNSRYRFARLLHSNGRNGLEWKTLNRSKRVVVNYKNGLQMTSRSSLSTDTSQSDNSLIPTAKVEQGTWKFRGLDIGFLSAGIDNTDSPAVLLVHGFGASSGHFRYNLPELGKYYRTYAVCLLGFGRSAKPQQYSTSPDGSEVRYDFDTWSQQILAFSREIIGSKDIVIVANSIGVVASLQAVTEDTESMFRGLVQLDTSLRMLNVRKRDWLADITAPIAMKVLKVPAIGDLFFNALQSKNTLRKVLEGAYGVKSAVDDELLEILAAPARDPGALDVFLSFIS